jgi:hypothetical protein
MRDLTPDERAVADAVRKEIVRLLSGQPEDVMGLEEEPCVCGNEPMAYIQWGSELVEKPRRQWMCQTCFLLWSKVMRLWDKGQLDDLLGVERKTQLDPHTDTQEPGSDR